MKVKEYINGKRYIKVFLEDNGLYTMQYSFDGTLHHNWANVVNYTRETVMNIFDIFECHLEKSPPGLLAHNIKDNVMKEIHGLAKVFKK